MSQATFCGVDARTLPGAFQRGRICPKCRKEYLAAMGIVQHVLGGKAKAIPDLVVTGTRSGVFHIAAPSAAKEVAS